MLKEYKNELFQTLLTHEIGIDNLEINENFKAIFPSLSGSYVNGLKVSYKPMPKMQFVFLERPDSFELFNIASVKFTPALELKLNQPSNLHNFRQGLEEFKLWLVKDLKGYIREVNEIDLWSTYLQRKNANDITTINYADQSNFSKEETESIKIALSELKVLINERYTKNDVQQQIVAHHIKYLTERVEALSKTDYKGVLINTFISICIALSLDSQKGAELMQLIIQVFQFSPGLLHAN
ncbi:MAG: hypothetical protein JWQ34_450 [Mucilaginibacter sp.]|uniref:hypothetical protein n=1 Tax=Mucilaginibacter sp. TaxID=1882438 RepID=UPI0026168DB2|nr:hypothetical protein [Mucilaginibacter sp.]MDB5002225.1 hypothetical protein [Mucilaginibacter sp.]